MSYGCHNRPLLLGKMMVQDGFVEETFPVTRTRTRHQIIREIPIQTSLNCQYSKDNPGDQQCAGCSNQHQEKTT